MPTGIYPRRAEEERFLEYVNKNVTCWLWNRPLSSDGYGVFYSGYDTVRAHRYSYEMAKGKIPDGLVIDHLCRMRACVNPAHLEAVTPEENNRRSSSASMRNAVKTHCVRGHKLSDKLFKNGLLKNGKRRWKRMCVICKTRKYLSPAPRPDEKGREEI